MSAKQPISILPVSTHNFDLENFGPALTLPNRLKIDFQIDETNPTLGAITAIDGQKLDEPISFEKVEMEIPGQYSFKSTFQGGIVVRGYEVYFSYGEVILNNGTQFVPEADVEVDATRPKLKGIALLRFGEKGEQEFQSGQARITIPNKGH
ncbi:hypothetical protein TWF730_005896 [Orbilia blumenaviensis]|uniref:Uncharacterized protein n=1 Tax=Orbilia blumenaviensis TaxID=1796055 RepID=A0AAV9VJQ8_9PEZI